ncbi:MAG: histidine kinase [bacterium]
MLGKNRITKLLLNYYPFIISLVIFLIILIIQPFEIKKYRIQLDHRIHSNENYFYTYADLDGDDYSEMIRFICLEEKNLTGVVVYKNNKVVNQWNFDGIVHIKNISFLIGDYNHNHFKEITLFTHRNDTIFLHMIEPLADEEKTIKNEGHHAYSRPLIKTENPDFMVHKGGFANFDAHPWDELYFSITPGGYIKQPRRVCIYNIRKDTAKFSPMAGIPLKNIRHFDFNGDQSPEITGDAHAYGNHEDGFPYTDQKGWLMVFNRNLDFVFEPVSFNEFPMKLYVEPFEHKNETLLFVYHKYYGIKDITPKLYIYNKKGKPLHERKVEGLSQPKRSSILSQGGNLFFVAGNGTIQLLDQSLKVQKQWTADGISNGKVIFKGDINGDNKKELIFRGKNDNEFIITQNNLKHPASLIIPHKNNQYHFAVKKNGKGKNSLFTETNQITATYTYKKNLLYIYRYPLYAGIFGVIWFFVWLISRLQTQIIRQKYNTQQKINELQLKSVKNQIEPHFTFNLLNSISGLLYKEDIDKANDIIVKYSKLLRHLLVYSDKIIISLSEEIKHIENYLEIEKYRFEDRFTYTIEVDPDINMNVTVPKMLIFTFVENAVKHGIKHLQANGFIHLSLSKNAHSYMVEIKDNGIGREKAAQLSKGTTKKGIATADKILNHYNELEKKKINYDISDLNDHSDENPGTHVKIYIPYGHKRS